MDVSTTSQEFSRPPTIDDLVALCFHLNEAGAQYVIIGGFAMIHHGFIRTTADIDLLIGSSADNVGKIKESLMYLPDQAVKDITTNDVQTYTVVRIGDEIVIDLLAKAGEVTYDNAKEHIEHEVINGVRIPYLSAQMMLKTKQSLRAQDAQDRLFLEHLTKENG